NNARDRRRAIGRVSGNDAAQRWNVGLDWIRSRQASTRSRHVIGVASSATATPTIVFSGGAIPCEARERSALFPSARIVLRGADPPTIRPGKESVKSTRHIECHGIA